MRRTFSILAGRSWGLIRYNSVLQNVAVLFYIGLARQWFGMDYIRDVVVFLLLSLFGTAYGYLVNDWADVELDRRAGKPNVFHGMRRRRATLVVVAVLCLMIPVGLPFVHQPGFVPLWLAWVLVATFYSLPPVRLKERGAIGLAATIAAQQPLPAGMAFAALGHLRTSGALVFITYITLRGICSDVGHQMRDRERDEAAGARTFAVRRGHAVVSRLYGVSLEIEAAMLALVLLVLLSDLPSVRIGGRPISLAWPLLVAYLVLLPLTVGRAWVRLARGEWVDPYDESPQGPPRDRLHLMHQLFPSVILPIYLAACLAAYYWPNVVFLVALILLYGLYDPAKWARMWPLRGLLAYLEGRRRA